MEPEPRAARPPSSGCQRDLRIDAAFDPRSRIAKALATVIPPQTRTLQNIPLRKFPFAPFGGPSGLATSARRQLGPEKCLPRVPALVPQPHPHKMKILVKKYTRVLPRTFLESRIQHNDAL